MSRMPPFPCHFSFSSSGGPRHLHSFPTRRSSDLGKMVSLSTIIPTPDGYTTMGDVEPGHEVIGRDGRPVRVAAKSPVKTRPDLYRVTFSDGQSVRSEEHTSELQSRFELVCRLLLEKKKK